MLTILVVNSTGIFISNFQPVPELIAAFSKLGLVTVRFKGVALICGIKRIINSLIRLLKDLLFIAAAFFMLRFLVVSYRTFPIINSFIRRSS